MVVTILLVLAEPLTEDRLCAVLTQRLLLFARFRQRLVREGGRQLARPVVEHGDAFGASQVGHMADQRIEPGPALGLIDRRHRRRVRGVGPQPIDRLGRQQDQPTRAQGLGRRGYLRVAVSFTLTFTAAGI